MRSGRGRRGNRRSPDVSLQHPPILPVSSSPWPIDRVSASIDLAVGESSRRTVRPRDCPGLALFIALSVLWGIPYSVHQDRGGDLSPAMIVWVRVALGALILLPIVLAKRDIRRLTMVDWSWIVMFAFVEIALPFGALTYAEIRLSSSTTAILIAAVPILSAIIGWRIGIDDRVTKGRAIGLAIGILGVTTLVGLDIRGDDWLSVAALGITIAGYSFGPMIVATKLSRAPALTVITMALLVNALVYAPFAWVTRPTGEVSAASWWSVVILGVLCTAAAFVVFFALVAEAGPSRTTVITFIAPAVALLLGVVVLSEPLTWGIAWASRLSSSAPTSPPAKPLRWRQSPTRRRIRRHAIDCGA